MKQIEIQLKPLAISKAYKGKRFKTSEYKKWQGDFAKLVGRQTPLTGQLALTVEFYIKNDKMSDIDNFFKATLDTMKEAKIIEDDRFIYEIHAYKYHSEKQFIRITLQTL